VLWLVILLLILAGSKMAEIPAVRSKLEEWARAIQTFEGWAPGTRAFRNNNPGNIRWPGGLPGQIGVDDTGHAIFDSFESGWAALLRQLQLAVSGRSRVYRPDMTLYEFFRLYAEENSGPYAEFVARQLGVSPETQIRELA
jgi:hypothetical protein